MPALDPSAFDAARAIVMSRSSTVGGHDLRSGEPLTIVDADEPEGRGEITLDQAKRLWARGLFVYEGDVRPTPVETPQQAALRTIKVDVLDGDVHLIRAPWLESEKVQGAEAAAMRVAELVAAGHPVPDGAPADPVVIAQPGAVEPPVQQRNRFTVTEAGSNGYFEITGPGLDEPEKVRGKDKAEARAAELEAGLTEG